MKIAIRQLLPFYLSLSLILVIGCGGSSTTTPAPPSIGKAYVTVTQSFSVLRFPAAGTGNMVPQNSLKLLSDAPRYLAADVPHDRLVATVSGSFVPKIMFVDNASTTLSPLRIISGAATTIKFPESVAVDSANDLVYVSDSSTKVLVFGPASTISGDVAPLHTITGAFSVSGLALDAANNRLFLSDAIGTINVFDNASTLNGTVVPDRVIAGASTQLAFPDVLALDNSGRLIVSNRGVSPAPNTILAFANAGSVNGNVAPASVFTLSASQTPVEMAVSPSEELYVVDGNSSLNVYSNIATATGNLVPVRTISGPNTGLSTPLGNPGGVSGIALDPTR